MMGGMRYSSQAYEVVWSVDRAEGEQAEMIGYFWTRLLFPFFIY